MSLDSIRAIIRRQQLTRDMKTDSYNAKQKEDVCMLAGKVLVLLGLLYMKCTELV